MAPLIALLVGFGASRLIGLAGVDALDGWQPALRAGLALMFLVTGLVHVKGQRRAGLIAMVPPRLPKPSLLVTVTGVLELAGAAGLLLPATAPAAAVCLALLLVVMFPANISAARRGVTLAGHSVPPIGRRTVLQAIFIAAAVAAI